MIITYNCEYEQRTNNIYFSIVWDLEILGRPNWESTQLTSIGKGPLNGPYKGWLMPCWHLCYIKINLPFTVRQERFKLHFGFQTNTSKREIPEHHS